MSVGPWQIVIVALVILLLFGASRLGDIGKGLGEGIKNFKKGITDEDKPPKQVSSKPEEESSDDDQSSSDAEKNS